MTAGRTLKEKILDLLHEKGPLTLKELHALLPEHTYRGVCGRIYELVNRGEIVRLEDGRYAAAEDAEPAPAVNEETALKELASLRAADLRVLHSLALGGTSTLRELEEDVGKSVSGSVRRLVKKGFVRCEGDKVFLSAKGAYVATFVHSYINMILRSSAEPTIEDAQAEMYRFAGILQAVMQNRDAILSSLENLYVAVESLSSNAAKLSRLIPLPSEGR